MNFDPRLLAVARRLASERIVIFGLAYLAEKGLDAATIAEVAEMDPENVESLLPDVQEVVSPKAGKGREKNKLLPGIEKEPRRRARTMIAEDAKPSDKDSAAAKESGMSNPVAWREWQKFINHHRSKGSLMADWSAAWRTWCMNWRRFAEERGEIAPTSPCEKDVRPPEFWRKALAAYKGRSFWPSSLGPEPGQPGCVVPKEIIAEFRGAA